MAETPYTTVDLLRHGEVQGGPCFRGASDDPLTQTGWRQMEEATNNQTWDAIISSPLCRCLGFAKTQSIEPLIHSSLQEINFGDWEGKTAEELTQQSPVDFTRFIKDPENNPPPNGEKLSSFKKRVVQEWDTIIHQYQQKKILIISHGGTMRTIISHVLNIPDNDMFKLEVPHASMSRIRIYHEGESTFPSLVFHGKQAEKIHYE